MSRLLNLFTGFGGKKYAPPPPSVDYRPPEIYRADSTGAYRPSDADDTSVFSEYCDPEDVIHGRGQIDSDGEYSVPFEGSEVVFYSAVAGHCTDVSDRAVSDTASAHVAAQLDRQWSEDGCNSFVSCTEGSPGIMGPSQGLQWLPRDGTGRSGAGGDRDNDDYDCPWDTGVLESKLYQMMKDRAPPSRTQSSSEQDQRQPATAAAVAGPAGSSTGGGALLHHLLVLRPGLDGGVSGPSASVLEASKMDSGKLPIYSDTCHVFGQPLAFANTGYIVAESGGPDEVKATVVSPAACVKAAECRTQLAVPREWNKSEPGTYVNHRPPGVSPLQALPPLSPGAAMPPPPMGDDPLGGMYDDPWDLRKVEEMLAASEGAELCQVAAASTDPERQGGAGASARRTCEPAPDAPAGIDRSSPMAQKSVLSIAAAFSCSSKMQSPSSGPPLRTAKGSEQDSGSGCGGSGSGSGSAPPRQPPAAAAAFGATSSRKHNIPLARPLPTVPSSNGGSAGSAGPVPPSPLLLRSVADRDAAAPSSRPSQLQLPQSKVTTASAAPKAAAASGGFGTTKPVAAPAVGSHDSIVKALNEVLASKSMGTPTVALLPAVDKKTDSAAGTRRHAANSKDDSIARVGTPLSVAPVPAASKSAAASSGKTSDAVISQIDKSPTVSQPMLAATAEKKRPMLPLKQQRWFHGNISRQQAEDLLLHEPVGSFLVRMSSTNNENNQDYSLSLRVPSPSVIHLKITFADGQYVLGQFSQPFGSIADMIDHYSSYPITIKYAEHVKLQKAISRTQ